MKRCCPVTVVAVMLGAASLSPSPASAAESAVDEVLAVVPREMAACVILDDLSGHLDRFRRSQVFRQIEQLPIVERLRQTQAYRQLLAAQQLVRFHFGIAAPELFDRLAGRAVVLAFRPASPEGEPDVGILFFRASDPPFLEKTIRKFATMGANGAVERRTHRGIEYVVHRGRLRKNFLLRIGAVGAVSDKESAIREVIDASVEGAGLLNAPWMRSARSAAPADAVAQVILFARPFDPLLKRPVPSDRPVDAVLADLVTDVWRALHWAALTLRIDDHAEIAWQASFDPDNVVWSVTPSDDASLRNEFWDRAPADALAVYAGSWSFPALFGIARRIAEADPKGGAESIASLLDQLLAGYDGAADLIPNLGPEVGLIVTAREDRLAPDGLGFVQLRTPNEDPDASMTLPLAVEFALRPLLVIAGFEWNKQHGSQWRAETTEVDGVRIHCLTDASDSTAPHPSYAVVPGGCAFATSPEVIRRWWLLRPDQSLAKTPFFRTLLDAAPDGAVFIAYADFAALGRWIETHRDNVAARIAKGRRNGLPSIGSRLDDLRSIIGLVDRVVVSKQSTDAVRRFTVSIYPSANGD